MDYRQRHGTGNAEALAMMQLHFRVPGAGSKGGPGGEDSFAAYVWMTQVQQGRCYETALGQWRRLRSDSTVQTSGVLYWQLNDVWPGPSWSSIEFSGMWKATHYTVKRAYSAHVVSALPCNASPGVLGGAGRALTPVSASAATVVQFYTTSDVVSKSATDVVSKVVVELWPWSGAKPEPATHQNSPAPLRSWTYSAALPSGGSSVVAGSEAVNTLLDGHAPEEVFLRIWEANTVSAPPAPDAFYFFGQVKDAHLSAPNATVSAVKLSDPHTAVVKVHTDAVAVFLCVETADIVGFFDDNNFVMLPGDRVLTFTSRQPMQSLRQLQNALSVRTVNDIHFM
jgi:beta-mannosidase